MVPRNSRLWLGAAAACVVAVTSAFAGSRLDPAGKRLPYEKSGCVHRILGEGLVYSFDAAWRVERIDPAGADRLPELRSALLGRLGVLTMDQIPIEGETEMRAIRALGYL